jgi:3-dehydro-L-gulonate 2-dehydrogenase
LSGGLNSNRIGRNKYETGLSQVFVCWDLKRYGDEKSQMDIIDDILQSVHSVAPIKDGESTYYPGEKTLRIREKQLKEGIEIDDKIWEQVISLKNT